MSQGRLLIFLHDSCLELNQATFPQVFKATCRSFIMVILFSPAKALGLLHLKAQGLLPLKATGLLHLKPPGLLHLKAPGLLPLKAPDNNFQARGLNIRTSDIHQFRVQGLLVLKVRGLNLIKVLDKNNLKVPWLFLLLAPGLNLLQTPRLLIPAAPHLVFLNGICLVVGQVKYLQVSWAIIQLLLKLPGLKILKATGRMMLIAKCFYLLRDLRLNNLETPKISLPKAVCPNSLKYLFKALVINHLKARGLNLFKTQEELFLKSEVPVLLKVSGLILHKTYGENLLES
ncbi:uncharacterized protein LOC144097717 [Amblyomma americanum]